MERAVLPMAVGPTRTTRGVRIGKGSVCFKGSGKAKLRGKLMQACLSYSIDPQQVLRNQERPHTFPGFDNFLRQGRTNTLDCHQQGMITVIDWHWLKKMGLFCIAHALQYECPVLIFLWCPELREDARCEPLTPAGYNRQ